MIKIPEKDYQSFIPRAERCAADRVYPLSIACGFQPGDIWADGDAALFWHYCGFAYISGSPSDGMLDKIYAMMTSPERPRRLLLITDDAPVIGRFRSEGARLSLRTAYAWQPREGREALPAPEGFEIRRIGADDIGRITGRIVPSFSWDSGERFLEYGFGFAAVREGQVCAVAFSAAVSPCEIDIGVETREDCRGRGLAAALADRMCRETARIGKKPVWAHAVTNHGSMRTALKCGFAADRTLTAIAAPEG